MFVGLFEGFERRPVGRLAFSGGLVGILAAVSEFTTIVVVSLLTGAAWHVVAYGEAGDLQAYAGVGTLMGLFYTLPFLFRSEYRLEQFLDDKRSVARLLNIWAYAFLTLGSLAFLTKTTGLASRGWLALFFILGAGAVLVTDSLLRRAIRALVSRHIIAPRRLMVIGTQGDVEHFVDRHSRERSGIAVVAKAIVPLDDVDYWKTRAAYETFIAPAIERARASAVGDVLILTSDETMTGPAAEIAHCFMDLPVAIHLGKLSLTARFPGLHVARIGALSTLALRSAPLNPNQLALKRLFDIVAASVGLIALAPLFLVVATLIKLDSPGPVFFRQRRRGFNLKEFQIWKFRSMTTLDDGDRIVQAKPGDARITRVGHYLRRFNIDELPQLINVLAGDMSIVGPRPHAVAHDKHYERVINRYTRRLNVKPGITGWAQVSGFRGETRNDHAMRSRVTHDLYYIENWSIALDLYIIALTMLSPKAFRNAH